MRKINKNSREHFKVIDDKNSTFNCPDEIGKCSAGFYEQDHKLICATCGEEIHDEAINKGICDDNRKSNG